MKRLSAKDILFHERYNADEGQSFAMQNASHQDRDASVSSEERAGPSTFAGNSKSKPKSKEPQDHRQHHAHHNKVIQTFPKEVLLSN